MTRGELAMVERRSEVPEARVGSVDAGSLSRAQRVERWSTRPSAAGGWSYLGGGLDHFLVDEDVVAPFAQLLRMEVAVTRLWHQRVLVMMLAEGIRQFVDLGCGLPTPSTDIDAVATDLRSPGQIPDSDMLRPVYVDIEPVVAAHRRILPVGVAVEADIFDPDQLCDSVSGLLDPRAPVGIVATYSLSHAPIERAYAGASRLAADAAVGSVLAVADPAVDASFLRNHIATVEQVRAGLTGGGYPAYWPRTESQMRLLPGDVEVRRLSDWITWPPGTQPQGTGWGAIARIGGGG